MYIHIHIYIYMYVYINICVYINIYVDIYQGCEGILQRRFWCFIFNLSISFCAHLILYYIMWLLFLSNTRAPLRAYYDEYMV